MPFIKKILQQSKSLQFNRMIGPKKGHDYQQKTLRKLVQKAQFTEFGKAHQFEKLLDADEIDLAFKNQVKAGDYLSILPWWNRAKSGEPNITWPGKVEYFAVSSGTTDNSSKYIPITSDMQKAIQRGSLRQIISIARTDVPKDHILKNWLMMGGSTELDYNGIFYSGDLSGITTSKIPLMFQRISKPEVEIKQERDWNEKIQKMTREAVNWDVGIIAGVPAWVQMLFENILEHYKISNIHELWPNFEVYIHGGVSLKPYKNGIDRLLGRPIKYFETYLASEGFMAIQQRENAEGMRLLFKNGIYFEFIPFNESNFNANGELNSDAKALNLLQVDEDTEYALLISTCSGAWRYLIGDVIKFTNLSNCEIQITGRTKHYLSLCGEHLSVDNMNHALQLTSKDLGVDLIEFTVSGNPHPDGFFAHHWYIGYDGEEIDAAKVKTLLDDHLKVLNDDYRVERRSALRDIFVELIPNHLFIKWMEQVGSYNAQSKFPRVMKGDKLNSWRTFVNAELSAISS